MAPIKMSKIDASIRLATEMLERIGKGDAEGAKDLLGDACRIEGERATYAGKEAAGIYLSELAAERAKSSVKIEEVFGTGHRCVARYSMETKSGENAPPRVRQRAEIYLERDGKICEMLVYSKEKVEP